MRVIANDVVYTVGAGNRELHMSKASKASLLGLAARKRPRVESAFSAIEVSQGDSGYSRHEGNRHDGELAFNCALRRWFAAFDNQRFAFGSQTWIGRTKREPRSVEPSRFGVVCVGTGSENREAGPKPSF